MLNKSKATIDSQKRKQKRVENRKDTTEFIYLLLKCLRHKNYNSRK